MNVLPRYREGRFAVGTKAGSRTLKMVVTVVLEVQNSGNCRAESNPFPSGFS